MEFDFKEETNDYSINEAAEKVGVVPQTLRQWEKIFERYIKVPRNESNQRYYTEELVQLFCKIKQLKDSGATSTVISKMLSNSNAVEEIKEQSLDLITVNQLTGYEFQEMLAKQFGQVLIERENELKKDFEHKLEIAIGKLEENNSKKLEEHQNKIIEENQLLKDLIDKLQEEHKQNLEIQQEKVAETVIKQVKSENQKLMDYIAATREEDSKKKGFFSKLFGK